MRTPLQALAKRVRIYWGAVNAWGYDHSADDLVEIVHILENMPAELAAAEQRGAERAFRKTQEIIAGFDHTIDEARNRDDMINTGYLIQEIDTEIQDLTEGDDD